MFFSSMSGYIGEFEIVDDHRAGKIVIEVRGEHSRKIPVSPLMYSSSSDVYT